MNKAELLAPAGNIEAFYAALEGGADAIYMGLKNFNARERALNFSYSQVASMIKEAHQRNSKVYITLNTVIKNNELGELLAVLSYLQKVKPDAIIIQDWGVYYLVKKHFKEIVLHASTQAANHNSSGINFAQIKGIERVIPARELSFPELKTIREKTKAEIEIFVHGALCYSFSGLCHFSSYLGGHGANRGLCTQPCRRDFTEGKNHKQFFSLKDNQQVRNIPDFVKLGIDSFKIEGRLKSADYVYRVVSAYRMVIDNPGKVNEAEELLENDMGREKTEYFLGGNVSDAITTNSNTGLYIGRIFKVTEEGFYIDKDERLKEGYRLRIKNHKTEEQINFKVKELTHNEDNTFVFCNERFSRNDEIFVASMQERKFSSKLKTGVKKIEPFIDPNIKRRIYTGLKTNKAENKPALFVRINNIDSLRKLNLNSFDYLLLNFSLNDWKSFNAEANFIQQNKHKIWAELPSFIPEGKQEAYIQLCDNLSKKGLSQFFLSHMSQKLLIPKKSKFALNENVYMYNDAAIMFAKSENAAFYTYPVENEKENYKNYRNKDGIVPVYFHPKLFISRMPVEIKQAETFIDDNNVAYVKYVKEGISYTIPEHPVSITQNIQTLKKMEFRKFLIDLSFTKVSKNTYSTIISKFKKSEQIQPSSSFNFNSGLK